jgi:hypothetical protein
VEGVVADGAVVIGGEDGVGGVADGDGIDDGGLGVCALAELISTNATAVAAYRFFITNSGVSVAFEDIEKHSA